MERSFKITSMICTWLTLVFLWSCTSDTNTVTEFGKIWNPQRESRGIRIIPSGAALLSEYEEQHPHWVSVPAESGSKPRWGGKIMEISDGNLIEEIDIFYSGRKYDDPSGGQPNETVRITFNYVREKEGRDPWKSEVRDLVSPFGRKVDLERAKKIILDYGLVY